MARPVDEKGRQEKVDLILDGAKAVFQRKGFIGVSMKDIIEECGISRGGIYLYFSSIDDIFRAVLAQRDSSRFEEVTEGIRNNVDFFHLLEKYFALQKERLLEAETSLLRATYEFLFTHHASEDAKFQTNQMEHVKTTINDILWLGVNQKAILNRNISQIAENVMFTIEGLGILKLLGGLTEQHIDGQFDLIRTVLLMQGAMNVPLPAKPLRVLVTAGDTSERIDDVRKIVNPATGRLGKLTADMFAMTGARVTYVCGRSTAKPTQKMEAIYTIESVEELDDTIEHILNKGNFDCIVHSMAVSEYTLRRITTAQKLAEDISRELQKENKDIAGLVHKGLYGEDENYPESKRIPPNVKDMVFVMDSVPNILAKMRDRQPNALIVGFLLLVDVPRLRLIHVAKEQLKAGYCDYVLANDMEELTETQHKAVLVAANGEITDLNTKQEIAQTIVKYALEHK